MAIQEFREKRGPGRACTWQHGDRQQSVGGLQLASVFRDTGCCNHSLLQCVVQAREEDLAAASRAGLLVVAPDCCSPGQALHRIDRPPWPTFGCAKSSGGTWRMWVPQATAARPLLHCPLAPAAQWADTSPTAAASQVRSLAITPEGALFTGSRDKTIKLWKEGGDGAYAEELTLVSGQELLDGMAAVAAAAAAVCLGSVCCCLPTAVPA